ncbi:MAG: hypothetical protein JWM59_4087 [Verrucomicrobiales bacterium]|nr:hypothetical protein [Verrucomicrobiales bacterium]
MPCLLRKHQRCYNGTNTVSHTNISVGLIGRSVSHCLIFNYAQRKNNFPNYNFKKKSDFQRVLSVEESGLLLIQKSVASQFPWLCRVGQPFGNSLSSSSEALLQMRCHRASIAIVKKGITAIISKAKAYAILGGRKSKYLRAPRRCRLYTHQNSSSCRIRSWRSLFGPPVPNISRGPPEVSPLGFDPALQVRAHS